MNDHDAPAGATLFLGMMNELSHQALRQILAAGLPVCGILLPSSEFGQVQSAGSIERLWPEENLSPLPIVRPYASVSTLHLAWENGIPVFAVGQIGDPSVLAAVTAFMPDIACVACFNQRIPQQLLATPQLGFLNLHPSLLPAHRGPSPLFWIFRNGDKNHAGVTVHLMDQGLDTGDILLQLPLAYPDGISGIEAEGLCGAAGGKLMVEAYQGLREGSITPQPQPAGGHYDPWPTQADFELDTSWSARRAFNFMRGTADWGLPYGLTIAGERLELIAALSYSAHAPLSAAVEFKDKIVRVQFAQGVLEAKAA